jgi:hypothetical protein
MIINFLEILMASSRLGFFDKEKHLGKFILEYLPDAVAKFDINPTGFQLEGEVNCCMITGIPNNAIVNAIKEGLGLKSSDAAPGYKLIDKNRRDNLYWLRVDYEKIGSIAANLASLNKNDVKENIVKLIIEKSSKRAEEFAEAFSVSIEKHKLSGQIIVDLEALKKMAPLKTIEEVVSCNALIKSMEDEHKKIKKVGEIKNTNVDDTSSVVPQFHKPGN